MKLTLFILLFVTNSLSLSAIDCSLDSANLYFEQHQYSKSIELYKKQIKTGCNTLELEYNLGNAYMEQNDIGNAILHYERALKIRPTDKDVIYNLETANARKLDKFLVPNDFFLIRWWSHTRDKFSSFFWGIVSIIILSLTVVSLLLWLFHHKRQVKKWMFLASFPLLVLFILTLFFALQKSNFETYRKTAIVLAESAPLTEEPNDKGTVLREVHIGTKVKIMNRAPLHHQVILPDGQKGWLSIDTHEAI